VTGEGEKGKKKFPISSFPTGGGRYILGRDYKKMGYRSSETRELILMTAVFQKKIFWETLIKNLSIPDGSSDQPESGFLPIRGIGSSHP